MNAAVRMAMKMIDHDSAVSSVDMSGRAMAGLLRGIGVG